jgi:hypothetical protein
MINLGYGKKPTIKNSQVINSSVLVRSFLIDCAKKDLKNIFDFKSEAGIENIIREIETATTINLTKTDNGKLETSEQNRIKLTYIKSNLGRGFIILFQCLLCDRKVKNLYFPPNSLVCACRNCHHISYF